MKSLNHSKITAFISYAHKDEKLLDQLKPHLSKLKRQGLIQTWDDRAIIGGQEWAGEIAQNLERADVILLLISADFINSDYCWGIELERAVERHENGTARVVPIILRPTDWSDTPFSKFQAFPKNGEPVTSWNNRDEAFVDIAKGLRRVVEDVIQQKEQTGAIAEISETNSTPKVSLHVHGWTREEYDEKPTKELDWTSYFYQNFAHPDVPRDIPSPEVWANTLYPQLEEARETLTQGKSGVAIALRGRFPLTVALAIGKVFPIAGHTIQVNQNVPGKVLLWSSDALGSDLQFQAAHTEGNPGPNLLVAIDVGRSSIWRDAQRLYRSDKYAFDAVVHLKSPKDFLDSAAEANALAEDAVKQIRDDYLDRYQPEQVHLVMACPQSLAVFIGQRLRFCGKVATYEHQPTAEDRYVPSVVLYT